jgi:hypothetical protein
MSGTRGPRFRLAVDFNLVDPAAVFERYSIRVVFEDGRAAILAWSPLDDSLESLHDNVKRRVAVLLRRADLGI